MKLIHMPAPNRLYYGENAYQQVVESGGQVADAMRAFHTFLGHSDMMAYLAMMAPRLLELKRVLKPTVVFAL